MENKKTMRSWVQEREKELKSLESEVESLQAKREQVWAEIANCEDEIKWLEKLQTEKIGERFDASGKAWLVQMKKKLEDKKSDLEKNMKELEAKLSRSYYLGTYLALANKFWPD